MYRETKGYPFMPTFEKPDTNIHIEYLNNLFLLYIKATIQMENLHESQLETSFDKI